MDLSGPEAGRVQHARLPNRHRNPKIGHRVVGVARHFDEMAAIGLKNRDDNPPCRRALSVGRGGARPTFSFAPFAETRTAPPRSLRAWSVPAGANLAVTASLALPWPVILEHS
jgi:hypothetical protein